MTLRWDWSIKEGYCLAISIGGKVLVFFPAALELEGEWLHYTMLDISLEYYYTKLCINY